MFAVPKSALKPPAIKRISVKSWTSGTVTAFDDGRTPAKGLRSSGNVLLDQDGTIRPRPSLTRYGPQPTGTILGEIFEFRALSGLTMTNWMISLQNVAGTTKAYIAKGEDTSWTVCNGKTYDNTAHAHFCQIQNKILIMNGVDSLSYLDIPTSAVIPFTALSNATAPTVVNNGSSDVTSGTAPLTIYYAVTANSTVGETAGSPTTSQVLNKDRDLWDPATNSLKVTWSAVTSARDYNVYMGQSVDGGGTPVMYLIASGINGLALVDDGSRAQDLTHPLPLNNSTAGPKASRGTVINDRAWLVGDHDNPFYVWRGGDYGYELDFSPVNGGGFTPIGNGTKELPVKVMPFRDGKGTSQITVLCQGTNGRGKRYILTPDSLTFGSTTISFYDVTEDNGQDGTDSPDGVVLYNDSLWYPSRDGFKTTGTKPQLQNVLSTDRVSNTIQRDIATLNNAAMGGCVGVGFEGRIYWALPANSNTNNQIWVLDLDREGAWMKPWSISADWMWLYNDNSGTTHFMVLDGNVIYELSYTALTADDNTTFQTNGDSGQINFSDDGREWGKLIQLVFVLLRPQGKINFTVSGRTEDSSLAQVGSSTFLQRSSRAGWSEPGTGWSRLRGWSEIIAVPVSFNEATQEVLIDVDEDLQWYSYGWSTVDPGVDYNISDVIAVYVPLGIKNL